MNVHKIKISVIVGILTFAVVARSEVEINRFTIDGGGMMFSTGGNFELSGTIGQTDAGVMVGEGFKLTGGFWFESPPGDCNADGIVSLLDHNAFANCMTGPSAEMDPRCECFDVDQSGAVDLADFSENQRGSFRD
jgi:hypothetical protein